MVAVWSSVLNKLNTLSWVAVRARRADVAAVAAVVAKASEERRSTIIGGDDAYWQAVAQNDELWEQPQRDAPVCFPVFPLRLLRLLPAQLLCTTAVSAAFLLTQFCRLC